MEGDSARPTLPSELRFAAQCLLTIGAIALAASFDILAGPGLQAMFYLPAILLVTLMAGWQAGVAGTLASIALGWYLAVPRPFEIATYEPADFWHLEFFAATAAIVLGTAIVARRLLIDMKQTEARLRSLVEAAGIVLTTDRNGQILVPHPGVTDHLGIAWEDYRGYGWRNLIHPEDRDGLPNGLRTDGTNSFIADIRVQNANTKEWRWHRVRALPLTGADGAIREWVGSLTDIHEGRLAGEQRELLVGELRHRMKNLVTVIDGLAKSSRSGSDGEEIDAFLRRFLGRLHALGAATDLMLASDPASIETSAVIRATLKPFEMAQFDISGPVLQLSEQTAGALAMAVHELATNALKYGALSTPQGKVSVGWTRAAAPGGEQIIFEWAERGGPKPVVSAREGFGTRLIKFVPAHEKSGDVKLEYRPEGFCCRIEFVKAQPGRDSASRANSATPL